jgi:hypothetical protein
MKAESKSDRVLLGGLAAALVLGSLVAPAPAQAADCLLDYANCVDAASEFDTFGRRSFAGLRCYADLISCLQRLVA